MKNCIFTLAAVFLCATTLMAQRMAPKQKGLEVGAGVFTAKKPGDNYYLSLALTVNGKNGNYLLWTTQYDHRLALYKSVEIPVESYFTEAGYSFQLLGNARKSVTFNLGLTGVLGYETFNRGEELLEDGAVIRNKNAFVYGAGGRLSLEAYLSDRFVLMLQGRAKMLWGTSMDQLRPAVGVGLRFNF